MNNVILNHLDLWTGAVTKKSSSGRGSNGKVELTGVKKLRELILELAVHGKLVEQYPADTPADQLLERIAERRKELISAKKIKNSKLLPPVAPDEAPSELPAGWAWTRLGSIAEINPRNTGDDTLEASFIPMPLVTTSYHGEHGDEPRNWGDIKKGYSHFANGDVGLAKITPCFENSKAAVFRHLRNGIGAGTTELHVARPLSPAINPYFLLLFLKSPRFLTEGEKVMTGSAGQKRVPKGYFSETPLPLPPEEEQHRIVQKVDELMAHCDRLEQQTSDQLEAHETLVDTLLGTLTQSENATELADNWARLAAHFDTLFTTEQSIDKLKQTILQLAVMGRLVEQSPTAEPFNPTDIQFARQRETLLKERKVKYRDFGSHPDIKTYLHNIPDLWSWQALPSVVFFQEGPGIRKWQFRASGVKLLNVSNILPDGSLDFENSSKHLDPEEFETKYQHFAIQPGDLLFASSGGSWGKSSWFKDPGYAVMLNTSTVRLRFFSDSFCSGYLKHFLDSQCFKSQMQVQLVGMQPNFGSSHLGRVFIPIPPIEEQRRIVQKVDELMALCDRLKERLNQANETRNQLAEAVVEGALN